MKIRQRFQARAAGLAVALCVLSAVSASADQGDCSQPVTGGASPAATDCLFILQTAVGAQTCEPECICAPGGSLPVAATDALVCLSSATGQPVPLDCPCIVSTTSTTTATTTTTSTTTTTLGDPLDIRGTYVGAMFVMVSNCVPPEDVTTFNADGSLTVDTQNGGTFSGDGLFTTMRDGTTFMLDIDFVGTVDGAGFFSGSYTESFSGGDFFSSGNGTYNGRLVIDTMTFDMSGTDTDSEGTTCDVDVDFAGER